MTGDLIKEFVDKKVLDALDTFLTTAKEEDANKAAVKVADVFGTGNQFKKIVDPESDGELKLINSFHNNLVLLIQKTWVEKTDEALKAQVLYQLEELCALLKAHSYTSSYSAFFGIVDDMVYLMFGNQTKTEDFEDYALRIDPEFGIFWWYVQSLPRNERWSETKSRVAILLGMYFLANY